MKVIKGHQSRGMKHIQYDCNDSEALKKRFTQLKSNTVDRLCQFLKKENKVIDAIDCYDAQSGWQGTEFKIDNADLSCNGYCLRNSNVELFLNGGQDPMWYRFWQSEYEEAKKWQESNAT